MTTCLHYPITAKNGASSPSKMANGKLKKAEKVKVVTIFLHSVPQEENMIEKCIPKHTNSTCSKTAINMRKPIK